VLAKVPSNAGATDQVGGTAILILAVIEGWCERG